MDYTFFNNVPGAIPKGTPRRIVKARKDRQETTIKRAVRAECVERDGDCIFRHGRSYASVVGECRGVSGWMHLEDQKRARTRGMEPTKRHTVAGSAMGCQRHHALYDAGEIRLSLTERGADGPIRAETDSGVYLIRAREGRTA